MRSQKAVYEYSPPFPRSSPHGPIAGEVEKAHAELIVDGLEGVVRLLNAVILHRLSHWAEGTEHRWDLGHRANWNAVISGLSWPDR